MGRDEEENWLATSCELNGRRFLLVAIYGPNYINRRYFESLRTLLLNHAGTPIIICGDWNCTYSTDPPADNLDIINMQNLPNATHSGLLKDLCYEFRLCDPFRCKYPLRRDFSFQSRDPNRNNRSRLDFFIVSDALVPHFTECNISDALQSNLFDHKAIHLSFRKESLGPSRPVISNKFISNPVTSMLVKISVTECYLHHVNPNPALPALYLQGLLRLVGRGRQLITLIGPDDDLLPLRHRTEEERHDRNRQLAELRDITDRLPVARLQNLQLNIDDDLFLDYLVNCIRNDVI